MIRFILSLMFLKISKPTYSQEEIEHFEQILIKVNLGEPLQWQSAYSKVKFLQYVATKGNYLFHGSNHTSIIEFTPKQQTLFNNEVVEAVFASAEPIWALFYAVFDRSKLSGSFRNGCFVSKNDKFVYYSINQSTYERHPWINGMMYIVPRSKFKRADHNKVYFDEWISLEPVAPLFKLEITVDDFIYKNKVAVHADDESLYKTLFMYKARTRS